MAKLHLIAVNHFDPAVRPILLTTLRELARRYAGPPGFVAVEYDKRIFDAIASQRPEFAEQVKGKWPTLDSSERAIIASSLAFDADAHLDVFSDVSTLWLDSGREGDVSGYGEQRLKMYAGWIGEEPPSVASISKGASDSANSSGPPDWRDRPFAERILEAMERFPASWNAVVAGWAHLRADTSRTMANFLKLAGVDIERHEAWTPRK